ncbi:hypothetical protein L7Q78_40895, partial [Achromobacter xylosoxidans]|nr:hypothetical protein [Achromobacter xylosoxidans]
HAGMRLELLVGGERHPEMGQVGQLGGGVHGGSRGKDKRRSLRAFRAGGRRDAIDSGTSGRE